MNFLAKLEKELRVGINEILKHPFLEKLEAGDLSKEQLQLFVEQYYIYNSYFPRMLGALAANIPDDKTRMPIVENLWEEHGSGDIQHSHRLLFMRFANACGVSKERLEQVEPLSTTAICCEHLLETCLDDDFVTSLGVLGPGTEYFTNDEYIKIVNGLRKFDFLDEEAIEFWTVHISLDEDHYSEMAEAILPWCNTTENKHRVKVGAKKAIDLEILFWDGIYEKIEGAAW